jgi:hypothetical protein
MNPLPELKNDILLRDLLSQEERLAGLVSLSDLAYSGLRDIDVHYELINTRFRITLALMDRIMGEPGKDRSAPYFETAGQKAREAVRLLEELTSVNVSLDQQNLVRESPGHQTARALFQEILLKGGAAFFEQTEADLANSSRIAETIAGALEKHAYAREDNYATTFKTENLPSWLRKLLLLFLPIFAREYKADPPYGIEEGEEEVYHSEKIKLPLSQAILLLEEEFLPALEKDLAESPGNPEIQKRINKVRNELEAYRKVKYFPRSTPVLLEKNFYTDGITGYSDSGEMLVTIRLPASYRSGTNLDRIRDQVEADIVRKLAGKGIDKDLDTEYRYLKKLESGLRGNSRVPSMKLDIKRWFGSLRQAHPLLRQIENKETLQKYIALLKENGRRKFVKLIEAEMNESKALVNPFP